MLFGGTESTGSERMRTGGTNFKDAAAATSEEAKGIFDWLNLPFGVSEISLWNALHDAHIVSIRSNTMERTVTLSCEIEHLRSFHRLDAGFQFILRLEGVQSARVLSYAIWPGGCSIPVGISREEEQKLVEEYQSKWREESISWNEFEGKVSRENEQVLDISDAVLATSSAGVMALKVCGHLNYAIYHEIFLRFEALRLSGSDGKHFEIEQFKSLGEAYWEAFSRRPRYKS
jgi:hypothetical protein